MEVLEFSGLPHNKAPFLTVGGFLFLFPTVHIGPIIFMIERAEAARAAARTRTAPGAAVPGGLKGRNASFKTAAAPYPVYPTDERAGTPARKAEQACGPSQGSPYSPYGGAGARTIGRLQSRRPRPDERKEVVPKMGQNTSALR